MPRHRTYCLSKQTNHRNTMSTLSDKREAAAKAAAEAAAKKVEKPTPKPSKKSK